MGFFIWVIVGLILLTITIFIHRHTYHYDYWDDKIRDKLSFPMWLMIVMCITAAIPMVNAIAFFVGMIGYLLTHADYEIRFHCESAWYKNLTKWLTREV